MELRLHAQHALPRRVLLVPRAAALAAGAARGVRRAREARGPGGPRGPPRGQGRGRPRAGPAEQLRGGEPRGPVRRPAHVRPHRRAVPAAVVPQGLAPVRRAGRGHHAGAGAHVVPGHGGPPAPRRELHAGPGQEAARAAPAPAHGLRDVLHLEHALRRRDRAAQAPGPWRRHLAAADRGAAARRRRGRAAHRAAGRRRRRKPAPHARVPQRPAPRRDAAARGRGARPREWRAGQVGAGRSSGGTSR